MTTFFSKEPFAAAFGKNGLFTGRVTGSTPFHPLVSFLPKQHIFTERVTSSTPCHPLVPYLHKRHFHREGYRLHPFSSSCFISSKTTSSPKGLPAPPLFILLFHILKNDIFTERVTGSTPFHPLVSYLEKRHFHREGYRLHFEDVKQEDEKGWSRCPSR